MLGAATLASIDGALARRRARLAPPATGARRVGRVAPIALNRRGSCAPLESNGQVQPLQPARGDAGSRFSLDFRAGFRFSPALRLATATERQSASRANGLAPPLTAGFPSSELTARSGQE